MDTTVNAGADLKDLLALNQEYLRSVQMSDVRRFRDLLDDDFRCSLPDGSIVDKATFLGQVAQPATISSLRAHDVDVRLLGESGDVAIVHGRTTYTTIDGRSASGRYTDVWAKRNGRWVAVAAHVTRN